MIVVLTVLYVVLVWLIFFKFKWLPFNTMAKIGVVLFGVLGVFGLVIAMNFCHPLSSDVRTVQYVIPIVPYTPKAARVTEVPVQPNVPLKKGDVLFKLDRRPFEYEVLRLEAALAAASQEEPQLKQDVAVAEGGVKSADAELENARRDFRRFQDLVRTQVVSREEFRDAEQRVATAEAAKRQADAKLERARLALESKINGEFTSVAQAREQLASARFNLEQTTVLAPDDGYVTNLQLRPGAVVAPFPTTAAMSFVVTSQKPRIAATFPQNPLRNIQPGAPVEIAFVMYPGRIFKAEVEDVIDITGTGQVSAGGVLPQLTDKQARGRFVARLKLLDEDVVMPGGASGTAVVYTDKLAPLGIIQKVAIRQTSYLNFLFGGM